MENPEAKISPEILQNLEFYSNQMIYYQKAIVLKELRGFAGDII